MTFKAIVESMIQVEAETALIDLIRGTGVEFRWTQSEKVQLEKDGKAGYLWQVDVEVTFPDSSVQEYRVGGTVDDMIGIAVSCVWRDERLVWLFNALSRKKLGMTKFTV